jgi:hypothetical protein
MRADPDDLFTAEPQWRPSISAEASSEAARAPTYDELWRRTRPRAPAPEPKPRSRRPDAIATFAAILLGVMALIGMRERIVRLAPLAAAPYAALGLPVNVAGFELRDVHSRIVMEGPRKVLSVEGEIVNLRRDANVLPPLALAVRGADGQDKYSWMTRAPKAKLERGETVSFRARLASPPENGADVVVRFASMEEVAREKPATGAAKL